MEFLKDLFSFLVERKKWWFIPIIFFLLLIGLLVLFAHSPLAPFIYTLF